MLKYGSIKFATMGQCYKTFYHGNLLPFHGNYQALYHIMTELPKSGSKLPGKGFYDGYATCRPTKCPLHMFRLNRR
jgi:hypothetical protein